MQRLTSVNPQVTTGRTKELLDTVQQAFGMIPNTARVMANSPAVLDSFLAFSTAMGGVGIGTKLHNQLKLTTSETNSCSYCTSILSAVAPSAGLTADDILAGRTGNPSRRNLGGVEGSFLDVCSRSWLLRSHRPSCSRRVGRMARS